MQHSCKSVFIYFSNWSMVCFVILEPICKAIIVKQASLALFLQLIHSGGIIIHCNVSQKNSIVLSSNVLANHHC
eukprot:7128964-Ditylum_brightwellii.AAC.1